jgi:hypothetical protein
MTMSDDANEGSAAMLGSVANSPVAWMVADPSGRIEACRESFDEAAQLATDFTATEDGDVIYKVFAVYRQPQDGVVLLPGLDPNGAPGWNAAIGAVREALANAGVDWDTE